MSHEILTDKNTVAYLWSSVAVVPVMTMVVAAMATV